MTVAIRVFLAVLLTAFAAASMTGCASYQLGRHEEPPFRTLYVSPVANDSFAPQAQAVLSGQIADHFLRDGLVRISNGDSADVTLEVRLVEYRQDTAATLADDTTLAGVLRLELWADCTLRDNRTGQVYFENRRVTAETRVYPRGRAQEVRDMEMPVLTGKLARRIGYEVLQVW